MTPGEILLLVAVVITGLTVHAHLSSIEERLKAMSDASTQLLNDLNAAFDKLTAKIAASAGDTAALAAAQQELADFQAGIKAVIDKASAA